jgi:hypothetical protein
MATLTDFVVICGLSPTGGFDGAKETDWYKLGIPVDAGDIWEFQFQCCHKTGDPNATVVGSFVMYSSTGLYVGTSPGPAANLTDSTAWQLYSFQNQFTGNYYVFPAIWWHAATVLGARYVCGVQMAAVQSTGALTVIPPDVLTLTTDTSGFDFATLEEGEDVA